MSAYFFFAIQSGIKSTEEWNLMQRIMRAVGLSNIAIDHLNTNYKCDFRQSKEQPKRHTNYKCDFRQSKKQSNRNNSRKNQSKSSNTKSSLDMYYRTLGLEPTANQDEIRKAYHNLAKMYHPDAVRDPALIEFMAEKFKAIAEAYDRLTHKS